MIICAIDLETTGLSAETDQVTEIGAVLWDTELNAPVKFFNKLLKIEGTVPELIVKLTGITDEMLNRYGEDPVAAWGEFNLFQADAAMLMAHNAPFDKGFVLKQLPELCTEEDLWIDTCVDVDYPEDIQTRKLIYLAAEHGLVNPFSHRALTDVLMMCQIASKYEWSQTVLNSRTPNITMRAMVSFEQNHKAKTAGYRWDAAKKFWIKQIKEHRVNDEASKCRDLGFLSKKVS